MHETSQHSVICTLEPLKMNLGITIDLSSPRSDLCSIMVFGDIHTLLPGLPVCSGHCARVLKRYSIIPQQLLLDVSLSFTTQFRQMGD